ncbi:MAG: ATP-binding protein [Desulfamplus sp.]|nr:ATP-binding protein [Desulfamplus sp.]
MSKINIKRAVENIKSVTNVYTPIIEMIVNSVEAIESKKETKGKITIIVNRSKEQGWESSYIPDVNGFEIIDNGIGFTDENRNSFDTLYSDYKIKKGGKGFGRFICLKYFKDLMVESAYLDNGSTPLNRRAVKFYTSFFKSSLTLLAK